MMIILTSFCFRASSGIARSSEVPDYQETHVTIGALLLPFARYSWSLRALYTQYQFEQQSCAPDGREQLVGRLSASYSSLEKAGTLPAVPTAQVRRRRADTRLALLPMTG